LAEQVVKRGEQHQAGAGVDDLADAGHAVIRRPGDPGGLDGSHPLVAMVSLLLRSTKRSSEIRASRLVGFRATWP
jgi:hypothetical protein